MINGFKLTSLIKIQHLYLYWPVVCNTTIAKYIFALNIIQYSEDIEPVFSFSE